MIQSTSFCIVNAKNIIFVDVFFMGYNWNENKIP